MSVHEEAREHGLPDVNPADRESLLAPSARHTKIGRFTLRQLSIIQWFGTIVSPVVWYSQHLFGYGVGQAICRAGGSGWGVNFDVYQLTAMSVAGLLEVVSWGCALLVFRHTKGADWGDGPPEEGRWGAEQPYGRLYFFACAGMVANVLFLTMILLDGTAAVTDVLCRQS
jgi:hypothetical protein